MSTLLHRFSLACKLALGALGTAAAARAPTINALSIATGNTINGIISGGGSLSKAGTGILNLTGANSYSGGTTSNVGTLAIANHSALGTGGITFGGGPRGGDSLNLSKALTLPASGVGVDALQAVHHDALTGIEPLLAPRAARPVRGPAPPLKPVMHLG